MVSFGELFVQAGFPDFPLGTDGFPQPGPVIKEFRRRMHYRDAIENKERHWTQANLASALGLTETMVGLMETQSVGLDSISRRRVLADLLKIPPIFLGLGPLSDLETLLKQYNNTTEKTPLSFTKGQNISTYDLSLYQDALSVYWDMNYAGAIHDVKDVQRWSNRIERDLSQSSAQKASLAIVLCGYYQLLADVYDDNGKYKEGSTCLDDALEIATAHENTEMQAATFHRYMVLRLDQRKFALAKMPADMALSLVESVTNKALQGTIYQTAGLVYALNAKDESDKTKAQKLLDKAGAIASEKQLGEDTYFVRFNYGRYALERADALLAIGRPVSASKMLDEAEEGITADQRRRKGYINILQAESYMKRKNPQFDVSMYHLQTAFEDSVAIHSNYNINYIARLCNELSQNNYNTLDIATLTNSIKKYRTI